MIFGWFDVSLHKIQKQQCSDLRLDIPQLGFILQPNLHRFYI